MAVEGLPAEVLNKLGPAHRLARVRSPRSPIPALSPRSVAAAAPARTPVILDTDIGTDIDDAWALGLRPGPRERFDLAGRDHHRRRHRRPGRGWPAKLLSRWPAAATCRWPWVGAHHGARRTGIDFQFQWAEDFTAKSPVGHARRRVDRRRGAQKHPGELTLHRGGPAPERGRRPAPGAAACRQLVKRLVLMSGCVYGSGQVGPDRRRSGTWIQAIADAQLVYAAGLPLTIVPLDSTTKVVPRRTDERERL